MICIVYSHLGQYTILRHLVQQFATKLYGSLRTRNQTLHCTHRLAAGMDAHEIDWHLNCFIRVNNKFWEEYILTIVRLQYSKWLGSTLTLPQFKYQPYTVLFPFYKFFSLPHNEGILPKGPYLPCVSMAGRALLAGYHRIINPCHVEFILGNIKIYFQLLSFQNSLMAQVTDILFLKEKDPFNHYSWSHSCWCHGKCPGDTVARTSATMILT